MTLAETVTFTSHASASRTRPRTACKDDWSALLLSTLSPFQCFAVLSLLVHSLLENIVHCRWESVPNRLAVFGKPGQTACPALQTPPLTEMQCAIWRQRVSADTSMFRKSRNAGFITRNQLCFDLRYPD